MAKATIKIRPLSLTTMPLYGILVSEKSFLLARRRLAKAHYAKFLAFRVTGSHLPAELVDQIADALIELEKAEILQLWHALKEQKQHRQRVFMVPANSGTEAEQAAINELGLLEAGALCSTVIVDRSDGEPMRYVHISGSISRPDLAQLYPGSAPASGPALQFADGNIVVCNHSGTTTSISREHSKIRASLKRMEVGRLVQIDGIEDAIKYWDQEAVENLVESLRLTVVHMAGEGGGPRLMPRLRLLQIVEWT
jgi:hypothetical protein